MCTFIAIGLGIIVLLFAIYGLYTFIMFEKLDDREWENNHDIY